MTVSDLHELAALVQEGIDGATLALRHARAQVAADSNAGAALDQTGVKLEEAGMWLGRALERAAGCGDWLLDLAAPGGDT